MKTIKLNKLEIPLEEVLEQVRSAGYEVKEKDKCGGKPKLGECYFYICSNNSVNTDVVADWREDEYRYYTGNYFLAEEEAKKQQSKNFAIMRINKYIMNNGYRIKNVDWNNSVQSKYYIRKRDNEIGIAYVTTTNSLELFSEIVSPEACEDIIKNYREDLELIYKG